MYVYMHTYIKANKPVCGRVSGLLDYGKKEYIKKKKGDKTRMARSSFVNGKPEGEWMALGEVMEFARKYISTSFTQLPPRILIILKKKKII